MHSLLPYNTFHIPAQTQNLIIIDESTDLEEICVQYRDMAKLIIGGGSNILLVHDRPGITMINQIHGRQIINEDDTHITIQLGAGENRHETVMQSVQQGYRGMENLALIPGTVGAAPIQNIGAYGTEAANIITSVTYYDMIDQKYITLTHKECQFGYRDSIFKHQLKNIAFITSVTLTLSKIARPILTYGPLIQLQNSGSTITSQDIANTIIQIRSNKLPDQAKIGTAGSFFKNPIISQDQLNAILTQYPDCPHRDIGNNHYKIPAGRILDHILGYKGKNAPNGQVGCRHQQALVLVNHGGASGQQVRDRAQQLIDICSSTLGITLEPEVHII